MFVSDILRTVIPQPAARLNPCCTDRLHRHHRRLRCRVPAGVARPGPWAASECQPGGCQLGAAPAGCRQRSEGDAEGCDSSVRRGPLLPISAGLAVEQCPLTRHRAPRAAGEALRRGRPSLLGHSQGRAPATNPQCCAGGAAGLGAVGAAGPQGRTAPPQDTLPTGGRGGENGGRPGWEREGRAQTC